MNRLRLLIVALIVIVLVFAAQCLYTVKPYEDVVQLRLGSMVEPHRVFSDYNLYLKWPSFIDRYIPIDKRLQVTDAVLETINTSGRQDQNFQVAAACSGFWKVSDSEKFYTSLLSTVKEDIPEPGNSFPKQVNDKIRDTIRSSVNNVFGEARLSDLFGLPQFEGTIARDCLAIDGNTFLPKGLRIRGGQIKRTTEIELAAIAPDGTVVRFNAADARPTDCVVIILYGYDRESAQTSPGVTTETMPSYSWIVKPDPAGSEGLGRKELTLAIPLKYILDRKVTTTVQIDRIQKEITKRVNAQAMSDYGVQVSQVEIRRLSFPPSSLKSVYDKMKSERDRISGAYVSSGKRDADIIRSNAELEASRDLAKARGMARALKGQADARAAEIAAGIQKLDPEFYNWLQSLETAAAILKNKSWVVLSTDQAVMNALFGRTSKEDSTGPAKPPR
ncbi:MAG: hypothetical protein GWP14_08660 [Actinobacteria bacterium]|nr:hypothetical protein [Actinomycetota bacterium]